MNNDQRGVRRLLAHYRRIANSATLDEAHLIEGYMARRGRSTPATSRRAAWTSPPGADHRRTTTNTGNAAVQIDTSLGSLEEAPTSAAAAERDGYDGVSRVR